LRNIFVTISRDARVRDILRLGTLDRLLSEADVRVVILTPADRDPDFVREFAHERIAIRGLRPFSHSRRTRAAQAVRRRLSNRLAARMWYRFVETRAIPQGFYSDVFDEFPPTAVFIADMIEPREWPVAVEASRRGVPVIGTVRSWDNILKGLACRVDTFCAPNNQNRQEAIEHEGYSPDRVTVTGTPQYDPYFDESLGVSRDAFLSKLGLDPRHKVVLLATAGAKFQYLASEWLDLLLGAARERALGDDVQILCRPHPADPLGQYLAPKYQKEPRLYIDMPTRWFKSLGWQMTAQDVSHVANLLRHVDVVVTPASTMTIESAIFDTPAVIVGFSEVMPEIVDAVLWGYTFTRHFKGILGDDLVPVAESGDDLMTLVRTALENPAAGADKRHRIVQRWVGPTDGRSSDRLARTVLECGFREPVRAD